MVLILIVFAAVFAVAAINAILILCFFVLNQGLKLAYRFALARVGLLMARDSQAELGAGIFKG